MVAVPNQLFSKASSIGLTCIASERGNHCIKPSQGKADWHLTYEKGAWVLIVGGFPQIRFRYDEAMKFLDRFA